jgi:methionyl-tRNA formyltransferase
MAMSMGYTVRMEKKSIVFCGTPDFAIPSLRALAGDPRFDVRLVITQPDRPIGRSGRATPPAMKKAAIDLGIEVWQPEKLNVQLAEGNYKAADRPDFLVVVAYGQLLSSLVLEWPTIAPINVHGSLLPRWRGASPVEHAILHGDTETGIAVQRMVKELDAGPILGIAKTPIGERETALQLRERLSAMGADLLVDVLSKPLVETPQSHDGVTICRKLSRDDGKADTATMTAVQIDRMARALYPWPGVTATVMGREVKIIETALEPTATSTLVVCAENSTLEIVMIQEAGKKAMTGAEWARGVQN